MPIKIQGFGGPVVWQLRKYHSDFISAATLSIVGKVREKKINRYIDRFLSASETPCFRFVMLETVNRCNGTCDFCPANARIDKREYKKMTQDLFDKIIGELRDAQWSGKIFLQVNNEPFLDNRILHFARRIRENLPDSKVCIITNGTLLNVEKMVEMADLIDEMVINDYGRHYRLSSNLLEIYKFARKNRNIFKNMDIRINRRLSTEILSTRAGAAPNKRKKNNKINFPCIYPFTDMIIFPDGKVGMCCNDCYEVTAFGDLNKESVFAVWQGEKFRELREKMRYGRSAYSFCKECDVVDAGSREQEIADK